MNSPTDNLRPVSSAGSLNPNSRTNAQTAGPKPLTPAQAVAKINDLCQSLPQLTRSNGKIKISAIRNVVNQVFTLIGNITLGGTPVSPENKVYLGSIKNYLKSEFKKFLKIEKIVQERPRSKHEYRIFKNFGGDFNVFNRSLRLAIKGLDDPAYQSKFRALWASLAAKKAKAPHPYQSAAPPVIPKLQLPSLSSPERAPMPEPQPTFIKQALLSPRGKSLPQTFFIGVQRLRSLQRLFADHQTPQARRLTTPRKRTQSMCLPATEKSLEIVLDRLANIAPMPPVDLTRALYGQVRGLTLAEEQMLHMCLPKLEGIVYLDDDNTPRIHPGAFLKIANGKGPNFTVTDAVTKFDKLQQWLSHPNNLLRTYAGLAPDMSIVIHQGSIGRRTFVSLISKLYLTDLTQSTQDAAKQLAPIKTQMDPVPGVPVPVIINAIAELSNPESDSYKSLQFLATDALALKASRHPIGDQICEELTQLFSLLAFMTLKLAAEPAAKDISTDRLDEFAHFCDLVANKLAGKDITNLDKVSTH